MSAIIVRNATGADLPEITVLIERYMAESLGRAWKGSVDALARDVAAARVFVTAALCAGQVIGFASWYRIYDVHHCATGAEVSDLFVLPRFRGRGVAPLIVAGVARHVEALGGRFVKGRGADVGGGLSTRIAVACDGGECYIGGGAFRALAGLADASPRALAKGLPNRAKNFEQ